MGEYGCEAETKIFSWLYNISFILNLYVYFMETL